MLENLQSGSQLIFAIIKNISTCINSNLGNYILGSEVCILHITTNMLFYKIGSHVAIHGHILLLFYLSGRL